MHLNKYINIVLVVNLAIQNWSLGFREREREQFVTYLEQPSLLSNCTFLKNGVVRWFWGMLLQWLN